MAGTDEGERMSTVPAGWHPDPSNPQGALRWWDGGAWTYHTQPIPPAAPSPSPPGPPPAVPRAVLARRGGAERAGDLELSRGPHTPGQVSFTKRNSASLTTVTVVGAYLILATAAHFVFLGILPVLMAFRAVQRKETLAPLAVVAAAAGIVVALLGPDLTGISGRAPRRTRRRRRKGPAR